MARVVCVAVSQRGVGRPSVFRPAASTGCTDEPQILLTNDDGIDSVGFRALYEGLSTVGDVVAVAPADDQSSVGRTVSAAVTIDAAATIASIRIRRARPVAFHSRDDSRA